MFILGDIMDHHETINVEYKEFCFKTNLFEMYTRKELKEFITSCVLLKGFNELILENIKKYIYVYVPRYVSSFHNSNYDDTYKLYIGINDHSEITGVPFNGNLLMFNAYFQNCIDKLVKENVSDMCCMSIKYEALKNEIDPDILSDDYLDSVLSKYKEIETKYNAEYNQYIIDKKIWINKMYFFKGKLQDVISNDKIKLEFIEFLEEKNLLKSFPEIYCNSHQIQSDLVKFVKNDPTKLVYWLIQFKDKKVNDLMKQKPVEPMFPKILNIEYCLLIQMSSLRKRLTDNSVNYFTILMTFKCNKHCKKEISYIDPRTKQSRTLTRYMCCHKKTPQCMDK